MSDEIHRLVVGAVRDGSVGVMGDGGSNDLRSGGSLVDDRVESVVVISGVVDGAHGTVRLHQRVLSLDHISVALLHLGLDVAGVVILDSVVERVLGVGNGLGNDGLVDGGSVGVGGGSVHNGSVVSVFDGRRADGSGQEQCSYDKLKEYAQGHGLKHFPMGYSEGH